MPFILPVLITNYLLFHCVVTYLFIFNHSSTSQADEFPKFSVDSLLSSIDAALYPFGLQLHRKACIKLFFGYFIYLLAVFALCSLSSSHLSFMAKVKFPEEIAAELCRYVVVRFLGYSVILGILWASVSIVCVCLSFLWLMLLAVCNYYYDYY